jgi:hypothetical protein
MLKLLTLAGCLGCLLSHAWAAEAPPPAETQTAADDKSRVPADPALAPLPDSWWRDLNRWSFQAGVAFITESSAEELILMDGRLAKGDAAGEIYLMQVSYKLATLQPRLLLHRVTLDLELPLVLGVVDEAGTNPFMQYSGGFVVRWKTFPWNDWLYTNLETGIGMTYSQHVLATEREQHPDRDRSHVEFYWPVQLSLAHPRWRQHQLGLFLHHHSGGGIFHRGGANSLGIGYRYVPGERSPAAAP